MSALHAVLDQFRLAWRLLGDSRVPLWMKAVPIVIPLAYLMMPIDIIPDFFVGAGQLDDLVVILIALRLFIGLVPDAIVNVHLSEKQKRRRDAPVVEVVDYQVSYPDESTE